MAHGHEMQLLKFAVENNTATDEFIQAYIDKYESSKQNVRGLVSLVLRYYINTNNDIKIKQILYSVDIMKRDYITCLEYFTASGIFTQEIEYIYDNINELDTKDIDMMIRHNWINLIKKFNGYPVICSYEPNVYDYSMLVRYPYDVSIMRNKYIERIKNKDIIDQLMQSVDILIDGANMSFVKDHFDFSLLPPLIIQLEAIGYKPKIVLHERHNVADEFLFPYLIRTPTMRNDDDYMIYGMLKYNIMVLTNDNFRDHLKTMDIYTKCYVNSMIIKQNIIPSYTNCIQIIDDSIYIPCRNGFYKL